MCEEKGLKGDFLKQGDKKRSARISSGLFSILEGLGSESQRVKGIVEVECFMAAELSLSEAFGSPPMIDMGNMKGYARCVQCVEKSFGIRPPRVTEKERTGSIPVLFEEALYSKLDLH